MQSMWNAHRSGSISPLSLFHTRAYATINGLGSPAAKPGYSISI